MKRSGFIPALRYDVLTPLFDPILRWTMRDAVFKGRLIQEAAIRDGHRVLDLGCGTATLTRQLKTLHPGAHVIGLDGDQTILRLAAMKQAHGSRTISLHQAMSFALPYAEASFHRVLSSLLFHHLSADSKMSTLREVFRVLRKQGQLCIADWGPPQNAMMRLAFLQVRLLDGFKTTSDSVQARLPAIIRNAGFEEVRERTHLNTLFGTLTIYSARRP